MLKSDKKSDTSVGVFKCDPHDSSSLEKKVTLSQIFKALKILSETACLLFAFSVDNFVFIKP